MIKFPWEPTFGNATSIDQGTKDIGCAHTKHVIQRNRLLSHSKSVQDNPMDDWEQPRESHGQEQSRSNPSKLWGPEFRSHDHNNGRSTKDGNHGNVHDLERLVAVESYKEEIKKKSSVSTFPGAPLLIIFQRDRIQKTLFVSNVSLP